MHKRQCLCHSGKEERECCERFHQGKEFPKTALELMRSRYSAYALGLVDYIIETTHPDYGAYERDKKKWKDAIVLFSKNTKFQALEIVEVNEGELQAFVTFKADLRQLGKDASFTERSRFFKANGRWLYADGQIFR